MAAEPNPALGLIQALLAVPGLDTARYGLPIDIVGLRTSRVTASCTAGEEMVLLCDATAGAITITLPPVDNNTGRCYFIKKTDSSANAVTVDGNADETIETAASFTLSSQFHWYGIVCDGATWHRISRWAAPNFLALVDVPSSYSGAALKGLRVNAGATAVEFATLLSTFLELTDTPDSFAGQAGKRLAVNATEDALILLSSTFLGLTDVPDSYSGAGGKYVAINSGATAVEFITPPFKVVSSLVIDTNQDTEGDASYADCAGTGSVTTTVTCTLVITASFRHRVDNASGTSSVKLVNAADATLGTVIRSTAETEFQANQIIARVTGVAAGTYTCNLMHVISNAAYNSYVDDKQILIVAYPE